MKFFGFDFTSSPSGQKPITLCVCEFRGATLTYQEHHRIDGFNAFEAWLYSEGPWVAGFDFPFCYAKNFVSGMGWPTGWGHLAKDLAAMPKQTYLDDIAAFRARQPEGEKHLYRGLDRLTGGASPNNVINPPVGRMLFEGVPRLWEAGLDVPGLHAGDVRRVAVEAYPAVAMKHLIGTTAYKDGPTEEAVPRRSLRREAIRRLVADNRFGFRVDAPMTLAEDRAGDDIDGLICAVQAAWAFLQGMTGADGPNAVRSGAFDPAEGWIADPAAFSPEWELVPAQ